MASSSPASSRLAATAVRARDYAQLDLVETVDILVSKRLIDPVTVLAEIRNIVAVQHLENSLDLESLALVIGGIYEPEQFPGLILRHDKPKVTYLIFSSGKVVLAGSKSIQELGQAAENLKTIIQAAEALLS